uniref:SFRICE_038029 n=1 Tax=Spodoptera frugiperda TaxID=7108 RepID=A0A2H1V5X5_SPOFR
MVDRRDASLPVHRSENRHPRHRQSSRATAFEERRPKYHVQMSSFQHKLGASARKSRR